MFLREQPEPTLADVAALAGVSPTTVSRVLNNRGYLSQRTKDAVAKAMDELNYRPNELARSLLGSRTRMVGIIVPTVANPFFGELTAALERALADRGYRTLVCNSLGQRERERDHLRQLEGRRVDGIITGAHNESIAEYESARFPIVMVDRELAGHLPNVRADNFEGGRAAAQLLIDRGCRRPVLVTSTLGPGNLREAGYRDALQTAGLEPTTVTVKFGTPEPDYTRLLHEQLDALMGAAADEGHGPPDGVFATDDLTACLVYGWALGRGLRIPEDLKLVGFDGTATVRIAAPWLSTVQQPIQEIARAAADILVRQIEGGEERDDAEGEDGELVELPVRLIESTSTGAAVERPGVPPSIWSN